jgi:hypothetical protein
MGTTHLHYRSGRGIVNERLCNRIRGAAQASKTAVPGITKDADSAAKHRCAVLHVHNRLAGQVERSRNALDSQAASEDPMGGFSTLRRQVNLQVERCRYDLRKCPRTMTIFL